MNRAVCLTAVFGALVSASVDAAIVTYSDRAAFVAATGATSNGPLPSSVSPTAFTVGALTYSLGPGATALVTGVNWSTLISEPFDLAISGAESYNVTAPGPLFAFGFDFHEPTTPGQPPAFPDVCNFPCSDSTFTVTLLNGATVVDAFSFNRPNDSLEFVGVASTLAFDRVEVRDITNTADNEFFGNFLISRTAAVPEPATLALIGLGLLGLGFARRARID